MTRGMDSPPRRNVEPGQSFPLASASLPPAHHDTFGEIVSFVNRHSQLTVLSDEHSGASIAVWPAMRGRVLTSSIAGPDSQSYGWVNRDLIASGEVREHINAVGGEDRIWIGPEGGQFSIFFAPGVPFDLDHWYTPAPLDTEPFDVVSQSKSSISLRRAFHLTNYSGARFEVQIEREVRLLSTGKIWNNLGVEKVSGVDVVGFESKNKLTNLAANSWKEETGLLSLWILGQFQSTPKTTIILPIHAGSQAQLGAPVTSDYFGIIPENRLSIAANAVLFKADSNHRGKLGLSPGRAKGILGSYDGQRHVLTIVQYNQPTDTQKYLNSAWKIQPDPYSGDVANCYNDGPPSAGLPQLGRFYELESSSSAKALNSQEAVTHTHRTMHLAGAEEPLNSLCRQTLGVSLETVRTFNR